MPRKYNLHYIITAAIAAAYVVFWIYSNINLSVNPDAAYLTITANKILDGIPMSTGIYDPNPPLSHIIQIPAALLANIYSVPLYYAVIIYPLFFLSLCATLLWLTLKNFTALSTQQKFILTASFFLSNLAIAGHDFGERDQLIIMALLPFVFVQTLITNNQTISPVLKWFTLFLGSITLLIKPHYGIIPVSLLIHRQIVHKKLILFDADFIALSISVVLYAGIVFFFFNDYLTVILNDGYAFYANTPKSSDILSVTLAAAGISLVFAFISGMIIEPKQKIISNLFLMATLLLIPFYIQNKGFSYHFLPYLITFSCALTLFIHAMIDEKVLNELNVKNKKNWAVPFIIFLLCGFFIKFFPPQQNYLTHEEYKKSELVQLVGPCETKCSFFFFNDIMDMIYETATYSDQEMGSRFSAFWFLPALLQNDNNPDFNPTKRKYITMVTEDFKTFNPETLIIGHFRFDKNSKEPFDFITYFSKNSPELAKIFSQYNLEKTLEINRNDYLAGNLSPSLEEIVTYDIYKRKKQP